MEVIIYGLSSLIGGFALGYIFLSYFDNITESHVYMAVIGAGAFLFNLLITAFLGGQDVLNVRAISGSIFAVIEFAVFLTAGYFGRSLRLRDKNKRIAGVEQRHPEIRKERNG